MLPACKADCHVARKADCHVLLSMPQYSSCALCFVRMYVCWASPDTMGWVDVLTRWLEEGAVQCQHSWGLMSQQGGREGACFAGERLFSVHLCTQLPSCVACA